jgi:uncharacterized membrane protein
METQPSPSSTARSRGAARTGKAAGADAAPRATTRPPGRRIHLAKRGSAAPDRLATALGWFSVALGIAELLAPRSVSRAVGASMSNGLVRTLGARELAAGVGILAARDNGPWLWSRVAGDAMDVALIANAARAKDARTGRVALAAGAVALVAALDVKAGIDRSRRQAGALGQVRIDETIAINRTPAECYRFWRELSNLPRFFKHLEAVEQTGGRTSHWIASEAGIRLEWDSELLKEEPDHLLVWQTLPGADIPHAGTVTFDPGPGGRGALVRLEMEFRPPGGKAGAAFAQLFGAVPSMQAAEDLRRYKRLIETGEIATTDGQSSGPRSRMSRLFRKGDGQ